MRLVALALVAGCASTADPFPESHAQGLGSDLAVADSPEPPEMGTDVPATEPYVSIGSRRLRWPVVDSRLPADAFVIVATAVGEGPLVSATVQRSVICGPAARFCPSEGDTVTFRRFFDTARYGPEYQDGHPYLLTLRGTAPTFEWGSEDGAAVASPVFADGRVNFVTGRTTLDALSTSVRFREGT